MNGKTVAVHCSPRDPNDCPKTGRYQALDRPEKWRNGFISRADVGDFLLNQVEGDDWLRKSPVLRAFPALYPQ